MNERIPKIKKFPLKGNLQCVDINNRDIQHLLRDVNKQCLDTDFSQQWTAVKVALVHNSDLEASYKKKKCELKECRTVQSLKENLGFLQITTSQRDKIVREGLQVHPQPFNKLGKEDCGVCLNRFFDVELKYTWQFGTSLKDIFVFKFITGKCKSIRINDVYSKCDCIEPTPNYDSHICSTQPKTSDHLFVQRVRSGIYLYEYTEECEPSRCPRQCLPFAVISCRMVDKPMKSVASSFARMKAVAGENENAHKTSKPEKDTGLKPMAVQKRVSFAKSPPMPNCNSVSSEPQDVTSVNWKQPHHASKETLSPERERKLNKLIEKQGDYMQRLANAQKVLQQEKDAMFSGLSDILPGQLSSQPEDSSSKKINIVKKDDRGKHQSLSKAVLKMQLKQQRKIKLPVPILSKFKSHRHHQTSKHVSTVPKQNISSPVQTAEQELTVHQFESDLASAFQGNKTSRHRKKSQMTSFGSRKAGVDLSNCQDKHGNKCEPKSESLNNDQIKKVGKGICKSKLKKKLSSLSIETLKKSVGSSKQIVSRSKKNSESSPHSVLFSNEPKNSELFGCKSTFSSVDGGKVGGTQNTCKQSEKTDSKHKPEKTESTQRPERRGSNKMTEKIQSNQKPEKINSNQKCEKIDSNMKPEKIHLIKSPENIHSNQKPEQISSRQKCEKIDSTHKPEKIHLNHRPEVSDSNQKIKKSYSNQKPERRDSYHKLEQRHANQKFPKTNLNQKSEKTNSNQKCEKSVLGQKLEISDLNQKPEKSDSYQKPDKSDSNQKPEQMNSNQKVKKIHSNQKPEKTGPSQNREKIPSNQKPEKTNISHKPENIHSNQKPEKTDSGQKLEKFHSHQRLEKSDSNQNIQKPHENQMPDKNESSHKSEKNYSYQKLDTINQQNWHFVCDSTSNLSSSKNSLKVSEEHHSPCEKMIPMDDKAFSQSASSPMKAENLFSSKTVTTSDSSNLLHLPIINQDGTVSTVLRGVVDGLLPSKSFETIDQGTWREPPFHTLSIDEAQGNVFEETGVSPPQVSKEKDTSKKETDFAKIQKNSKSSQDITGNIMSDVVDANAQLKRFRKCIKIIEVVDETILEIKDTSGNIEDSPGSLSMLSCITKSRQKKYLSNSRKDPKISLDEVKVSAHPMSLSLATTVVEQRQSPSISRVCSGDLNDDTEVSQNVISSLPTSANLCIGKLTETSNEDPMDGEDGFQHQALSVSENHLQSPLPSSIPKSDVIMKQNALEFESATDDVSSESRGFTRSISMLDLGITCYLSALSDLHYQPSVSLVDCCEIMKSSEEFPDCKDCSKERNSNVLSAMKKIQDISDDGVDTDEFNDLDENGHENEDDSDYEDISSLQIDLSRGSTPDASWECLSPPYHLQIDLSPISSPEASSNTDKRTKLINKFHLCAESGQKMPTDVPRCSDEREEKVMRDRQFNIRSNLSFDSPSYNNNQQLNSWLSSEGYHCTVASSSSQGQTFSNSDKTSALVEKENVPVAVQASQSSFVHSDSLKEKVSGRHPGILPADEDSPDYPQQTHCLGKENSNENETNNSLKLIIDTYKDDVDEVVYEAFRSVTSEGSGKEFVADNKETENDIWGRDPKENIDGTYHSSISHEFSQNATTDAMDTRDTERVFRVQHFEDLNQKFSHVHKNQCHTTSSMNVSLKCVKNLRSDLGAIGSKRDGNMTAKPGDEARMDTEYHKTNNCSYAEINKKASRWDQKEPRKKFSGNIFENVNCIWGKDGKSNVNSKKDVGENGSAAKDKAGFQEREKKGDECRDDTDCAKERENVDSNRENISLQRNERMVGMSRIGGQEGDQGGICEKLLKEKNDPNTSTGLQPLEKADNITVTAEKHLLKRKQQYLSESGSGEEGVSDIQTHKKLKSDGKFSSDNPEKPLNDKVCLSSHLVQKNPLGGQNSLTSSENSKQEVCNSKGGGNVLQKAASRKEIWLNFRKSLQSSSGFSSADLTSTNNISSNSRYSGSVISESNSEKASIFRNVEFCQAPQSNTNSVLSSTYLDTTASSSNAFTKSSSYAFSNHSPFCHTDNSYSFHSMNQDLGDVDYRQQTSSYFQNTPSNLRDPDRSLFGKICENGDVDYRYSMTPTPTSQPVNPPLTGSKQELGGVTHSDNALSYFTTGALQSKKASDFSDTREKSDRFPCDTANKTSAAGYVSERDLMAWGKTSSLNHSTQNFRDGHEMEGGNSELLSTSFLSAAPTTKEGLIPGLDVDIMSCSNMSESHSNTNSNQSDKDRAIEDTTPKVEENDLENVLKELLPKTVTNFIDLNQRKCKEILTKFSSDIKESALNTLSQAKNGSDSESNEYDCRSQLAQTALTSLLKEARQSVCGSDTLRYEACNMKKETTEEKNIFTLCKEAIEMVKKQSENKTTEVSKNSGESGDSKLSAYTSGNSLVSEEWLNLNHPKQAEGQRAEDNEVSKCFMVESPSEAFISTSTNHKYISENASTWGEDYIENSCKSESINVLASTIYETNSPYHPLSSRREDDNFYWRHANSIHQENEQNKNSLPQSSSSFIFRQTSKECEVSYDKEGELRSQYTPSLVTERDVSHATEYFTSDYVSEKTRVTEVKVCGSPSPNKTRSLPCTENSSITELPSVDRRYCDENCVSGTRKGPAHLWHSLSAVEESEDNSTEENVSISKAYPERSMSCPSVKDVSNRSIGGHVSAPKSSILKREMINVSDMNEDQTSLLAAFCTKSDSALTDKEIKSSSNSHKGLRKCTEEKFLTERNIFGMFTTSDKMFDADKNVSPVKSDKPVCSPSPNDSVIHSPSPDNSVIHSPLSDSQDHERVVPDKECREAEETETIPEDAEETPERSLSPDEMGTMDTPAATAENDEASENSSSGKGKILLSQVPMEALSIARHFILDQLSSLEETKELDQTESQHCEDMEDGDLDDEGEKDEDDLQKSPFSEISSEDFLESSAGHYSERKKFIERNSGQLHSRSRGPIVGNKMRENIIVTVSSQSEGESTPTFKGKLRDRSVHRYKTEEDTIVIGSNSEDERCVITDKVKVDRDSSPQSNDLFSNQEEKKSCSFPREEYRGMHKRIVGVTSQPVSALCKYVTPKPSIVHAVENASKGLSHDSISSYPVSIRIRPSLSPQGFSDERLEKSPVSCDRVSIDSSSPEGKQDQRFGGLSFKGHRIHVRNYISRDRSFSKEYHPDDQRYGGSPIYKDRHDGKQRSFPRDNCSPDRRRRSSSRDIQDRRHRSSSRDNQDRQRSSSRNCDSGSKRRRSSSRDNSRGDRRHRSSFSRDNQDRRQGSYSRNYDSGAKRRRSSSGEYNEGDKRQQSSSRDFMMHDGRRSLNSPSPDDNKFKGTSSSLDNGVYKEFRHLFSPYSNYRDRRRRSPSLDRDDKAGCDKSSLSPGRGYKDRRGRNSLSPHNDYCDRRERSRSPSSQDRHRIHELRLRDSSSSSGYYRNRMANISSSPVRGHGNRRGRRSSSRDRDYPGARGRSSISPPYRKHNRRDRKSTSPYHSSSDGRSEKSLNSDQDYLKRVDSFIKRSRRSPNQSSSDSSSPFSKHERVSHYKKRR